MPSTSKNKTQGWCFVPWCDSGYKSCSEKVSLFRAPACQDLFLKWSRAIPRADKTLQDTSAVCAKHFDARYIQKEFRHIVNGVEVVIPRDIPVLRDDAVPTVFPNLPKYISKALPKERKRRESGSHSVPPKKTSTEPEGSGSSQEDGTTADVEKAAGDGSAKHFIYNLRHPSEHW